MPRLLGSTQQPPPVRASAGPAAWRSGGYSRAATRSGPWLRLRSLASRRSPSGWSWSLAARCQHPRMLDRQSARRCGAGSPRGWGRPGPCRQLRRGAGPRTGAPPGRPGNGPPAGMVQGSRRPAGAGGVHQRSVRRCAAMVQGRSSQDPPGHTARPRHRAPAPAGHGPIPAQVAERGYHDHARDAVTGEPQVHAAAASLDQPPRRPEPAPIPPGAVRLVDSAHSPDHGEGARHHADQVE
jgi:hypothetical protein